MVNWKLAGDIAENAINQVRKNFPKQSNNFFVLDMVKRNNNPDNFYDHVLSFGALAMYLPSTSEMKKAIKEAVGMTKQVDLC